MQVASQEKDCGKPAVKGSHIFDNMKKVKERTPVISPLPITVKQTKSGHRKVTIKVGIIRKSRKGNNVRSYGERRMRTCTGHKNSILCKQ